MKNHVPNEVSYKAARALAYLMTRKWWKELKDTYYKLTDNHYKESGLSIEDWILSNADINTVASIIPWAETETSAITWVKRHREFQKLWMDNFGSNPEPTFKVGDLVRVKEAKFKEEKYSCAFVYEMRCLAGQVFKIRAIEDMEEDEKGTVPDDGYVYRLENDENNWLWASSMLEKA